MKLICRIFGHSQVEHKLGIDIERRRLDIAKEYFSGIIYMASKAVVSVPFSRFGVALFSSFVDMFMSEAQIRR